jgi:hypothetical protein
MPVLIIYCQPEATHRGELLQFDIPAKSLLKKIKFAIKGARAKLVLPCSTAKFRLYSKGQSLLFFSTPTKEKIRLTFNIIGNPFGSFLLRLA